jgi:hypothetical protein
MPTDAGKAEKVGTRGGLGEKRRGWELEEVEESKRDDERRVGPAGLLAGANRLRLATLTTGLRLAKRRKLSQIHTCDYT